MEKPIIRFKKLHPDAIIPSYAKPGDAGLDLTAINYELDDETSSIIYKTGLAIEIPEGWEGQIRPRSSIKNLPLILVNSPGTIDSGYRGEILVVFKPILFNTDRYQVGDRIAQLVISLAPQATIEVDEELSQTERGEGGFGSTGK